MVDSEWWLGLLGLLGLLGSCHMDRIILILESYPPPR